MEAHYFLGVDISKKTFQTALTQDGMNMYTVEVCNNAGSIHAFMVELKKKFSFSFSQLTVCMEHTGIYCYPLLDWLVKNNVNVCVEPALQIKQSQGMTRGKSDRIDAGRIAQYACKNYKQLRFWKPQRPVVQKLKALLTLRERLVKTKVQLEVPIHESHEFVEEHIRKAIVRNCRQTLKALQKDIEKTECDIDGLISQDGQVQLQVQLATSVPGVGRLTALNVIIATAEFTRITDPRKFACYAGVAPFEHSSGSSLRGKTRVSKMANMTLKKLLHLAAMSAIQCSQELRLYYSRKVAEGKNKMSVLNAVRNKLIARIFVCIKQQRAYSKNYQIALV